MQPSHRNREVLRELFYHSSNIALHVAKELIAMQSERGWIGVSIQDLTPDLAKSVHAVMTKGALVAEVVKGGPQKREGLRKMMW